MSEVADQKESLDALRDEVRQQFRPQIMTLAPQIAEFARTFVYDQVWSRPGLSQRDRSLVTIGALVALGALEELQVHVLSALENGITKEQIGEIMTHLVPYAGFPRVVTATAATADLVRRADVGDDSASAS
jgi:4-carboxymuconolactone decarboxylase